LTLPCHDALPFVGGLRQFPDVTNLDEGGFEDTGRGFQGCGLFEDWPGDFIRPEYLEAKLTRVGGRF